MVLGGDSGWLSLGEGMNEWGKGGGYVAGGWDREMGIWG